MLILRLTNNESVCLGSGGGTSPDEFPIEITVLAIEGNRIKVGFRAPEDVVIIRRELLEGGRKDRATHSPEGNDQS